MSTDAYKVQRLLADIIHELEKLQEPNQYNRAIFDGLNDMIWRANLNEDEGI